MNLLVHSNWEVNTFFKYEKNFVSTGTYLDLRSQTPGQGQTRLLYPFSGSETKKYDYFL